MHITSKSGRVIELRPPQESDTQLIFDFAQTIEAEDTYILLNPSYPVTWNEESEYLKGCLRKIAVNWEVFYFAFFESRMIGSSQISVGGRRKMHVGSFGISLLEGFRHDGIGEQLAHFVIEEAKRVLNLSIITLEVFDNNPAAISLYRKLGFLEYGCLRGGLKYKGEFIDSILMYKNV